jgi:hypothetical protein
MGSRIWNVLTPYISSVKVVFILLQDVFKCYEVLYLRTLSRIFKGSVKARIISGVKLIMRIKF